jgi:hypothetical protein
VRQDAFACGGRSIKKKPRVRGFFCIGVFSGQAEADVAASVSRFLM